MSTVTIDNYVAGDSFAQDFLVRDLDGLPVDLTGASAVWTIASGTPASPGDQLLQLSTSGGGVIITDAINGKVRVELLDEQFEQVGSFVHELKIKLPDATVYTVARGVFKADPAVIME